MFKKTREAYTSGKLDRAPLYQLLSSLSFKYYTRLKSLHRTATSTYCKYRLAPYHSAFYLLSLITLSIKTVFIMSLSIITQSIEILIIITV